VDNRKQNYHRGKEAARGPQGTIVARRWGGEKSSQRVLVLADKGN
jgi:hypothetical protein